MKTQEEHVSKMIAEFSNAFIIKEKRERFNSTFFNQKKRKKFLAVFNIHNIILPETLIKILPSNQTYEYILNRLKSLSNSKNCYVISDDSILDDKIAEIEETFEKIYYGNANSLIILDPSKSAYIQLEEKNYKYFLISKH
ncbi:MAG: hypothetical protein SH818_03325 [Saprospiraceae bacterium]|nr:hypothetical protein [Saprospiraceae bacterium]